MSVRTYLEDILPAYTSLFGETASVQAFRLFMQSYFDLTNRSNLAGHVTGSAIVWHEESNSILRVYHAKLNLWVFSAGGHIDNGEMPWQGATRELLEETGITAEPLFPQINPIPFVVDAHSIPASVKKNEPAHWHYDLVYLYKVKNKPELQADPSEIANAHWVNVQEVKPPHAPVDLATQFLRYQKKF